MSKAIEILIGKLSTSGDTATHAASALVDQAQRNGSMMATFVPQLSSYLYSPNFEVRAAIATAIGNIDCPKAVDALSNAVNEIPASDLQHKCCYSCWSKEPLHYWLIAGIAENQNRHSAQALLSLVCLKSLPDTTRSCAMGQLAYFDLEDYELNLPDNFVEILDAFASSADSDIAMGAIRMLGQI